jgi:cell division inhibitor SepF
LEEELDVADDFAEDEFTDDEYEAGRPATRSEFDTIYSHSSSVRRVDRDGFGGPDTGTSSRSRDGSAPVAHMTPQVKMTIVEPRSFTEAQSIADKFKEGTPVILKLGSAKPDIVRRYIDFASGLVYGLEGGLQKIDERVYMLTPRNVEVSDSHKRQMRDAGVFTID